jgi:opacity protein-like surface antigen
MKKVFLLALMVVLVLMATTVYATEKYALGNSHIALKVDYFSFTDDVFDEVDLDAGPYIGLEGYYGIMPNLYLGLEAGWAGTSNDGHIDAIDADVDVDVNYVPIELNLKYALEVSPAWVISLGAGVSYSWFDVQVDVDDFGDADTDDWVFGGQVFADLTYKLNNQWFIGINGKYQFTEDLDFEIEGEDVDTDSNANNWRAGAQVGLMF